MKFLCKIIQLLIYILFFKNILVAQWVVDADPYIGGPYYVNVVDTGIVWCLGYNSGWWDDVELFTKCPEYGWQWGNGNDLPIGVQYLCIAGINSTTAFVGDIYGHVYKTTNYGWNWTNILNAGQNYSITDIKFSKIEKNVGYVFSALNIYTAGNFKIYKTTDYGNSWQLSTPFFGNYILGNKPQVWVTDSEHAWMGLWTSASLSPATIAYTVNGGLNWFTSIAESSVYGIQAIGFSYNNQFGMVITHPHWSLPKNRFISTNSGISWNFIDTIQTGNVLSFITVPETSVWYLNGMAYFPDTTWQPYIYKSSNNGLNWMRMTTPDSSEYFNDMDAVKLDDKIYAWATGEGRILKLVDTAVLIGINKQGNLIPDNFELGQNYPNPFNPVTKINYNISKGCIVKISVYNVLGYEIKKIVNDYKPAGSYEAEFDGSNLPSGLYIYRIETPYFSETKKMVLIK